MEDSILHSPTSVMDSLPTTLSLPFPISRCIFGDYGELRSDDDYSAGNRAYSKPFLVLNVVWNLAFVLVSMAVLFWSMREKPSTPLRVWIGGYALQCFLHVGFIYFEYQSRITRDCGLSPSEWYSSIVKRLESLNMMASSFWWVIGFYWIVAGGQTLLKDSPRIYWLAVVFLALDVFFMIFCIGMACVICLILFCCIPIVAIAHAMTIREGASEEDIQVLPKYRFRQSYPSRVSVWDLNEADLGDRNSMKETVLLPEDSECCICLAQYIEGAELCSLPCNHHFHYGCISRWLQINATCPSANLISLGGTHWSDYSHNDQDRGRMLWPTLGRRNGDRDSRDEMLIIVIADTMTDLERKLEGKNCKF
ncbi:hypothetical protein Nepgr_009936 [Nepenthes gracilis]|uniref:RING-type E3 ubiquitin transferase n=1 Tax=Nepenthes gracilis TaxID=150966 RepID=A0AAD3SC14_NEPGR|nr:hypothetical protein Nepgr_009936 [Nepenthes gracilis]